MAQLLRVLADWIVTQSALTGMVFAALGLVAGLHGFRMIRVLLACLCGGLGYAGGLALAAAGYLPQMLAEVAGVAVGGLLGLAWPRPAGVVAFGVVWAVLGAYFVEHLGLRGLAITVASGLLGSGGAALTVLNRRTMTVITTSMLGAGLIIMGLTGLGSAALPVAGHTFRGWMHSNSPVIPVLLVMLGATLYSYQASARQGTICTGAQAETPAVKP